MKRLAARQVSRHTASVARLIHPIKKVAIANSIRAFAMNSSTKDESIVLLIND